MADKEYIERGALKERLLAISVVADDLYGMGINRGLDRADTAIDMMPAADVVEVNKVAKMLRIMFDDDCACNYNGNDEWLPFVCDYGRTECPDAPEENGCWKQFVKHFLAKMDATDTNVGNKSEWISVEERLPEESGLYLAFSALGNRLVLDYSAKHKLFNSFDSYSKEYAHGVAIAVTHWMPLPEPPKGE